MLKRIALLIQIIFYFVAGANHFRSPVAYIALIPPYLPWHSLINIAAGIAEMGLAVGLCFRDARQPAAFGIIILLLFFIPAHIYFIQTGGCIPGVRCFPGWVGWVRLLVIHPLLIAWAWWCRK